MKVIGINKKESHMQCIIEKDGELYENTKLWVSVDDLIEILSKLKSEAYIELLKELRK